MKKVKLIIGIILLFSQEGAYAQHTGDEFDYLLNLAVSNINVDSDSVLYYADSAYNLTGGNNPENQLQSLFLIINTQIKQGKLSTAILNCKVADSIVENRDVPQYKAKVLMYFGLVYNNSGLNSEGIQYLHQAIDIDEKSGITALRTDLDYYLAQAYYLAGEFTKCRNISYATMKREIHAGDTIRAVDIALLLSNTFQNPDSIKKYLVQVESLLPKGKRSYKRVTYLNNFALLQKALGNYQDAKKSYIEAIDISITNNFQEYLANLYNNYAYLMMVEYNFDSSFYYLNKALALSKGIKNISLEAEILDSYSDYYASINDSTESFTNYKNSVKLKNEYRRKQQIEKALFLSTVFETEEKEQQIFQQKNDLNRARTTNILIVLLLIVFATVLLYFRQISLNRKTKIKSLENEKRLEVVNALVKGRDEERRRLSMDLHDGIMPRMGALKMNIETSFSNTISSSKTIQMVDDISKDIRSISHKLIPPQLESKGLVIALENFIKFSKQSSEISIDFYYNLKKRVSSELEVNLFYLAYEMINNAIKHAKADQLNVELLLSDDSIMLNVSDNGVGFDRNTEITGLGLKNIKHRVEYIKGKLIIDSVPNQGTDIIVEVKI